MVDQKINRSQLNDIVKQLFTALDRDQSGFLERDEIKTIAGQLHGKVGDKNKGFDEAQFDIAFSKLDLNKDGKVSTEELYAWFENSAKEQNLLID